jgi:pyrroline-5-carboxylate reductase
VHLVELVIVGGGKMGEALLAGLVAAKWADPSELAVVEPVAARRAELADRYPGVTVTDAPVAAAGAVLAMKPTDVPTACASLTSIRVLSIAAGVTIKTIEAALGRDAAVVRAMPNTPATVGAGASAIAGGTHATDGDLAWAEGILGAVGTVARVPEKSLDAVTGLSGSGPAYVFLFAEALIEGGVTAGLPRPVSEELAIQTLLGAARLLAETDDGPEALRAAVTSPGGTTAAGLRELERNGVRSAVIEAVMAATRRSVELGG